MGETKEHWFSVLLKLLSSFSLSTEWDIHLYICKFKSVCREPSPSCELKNSLKRGQQLGQELESRLGGDRRSFVCAHLWL